MPGIQLPSVVFSPDKIGHLAAYGLLAWLIFRGLKLTGQYHFKKIALTIIGVSFYGITLEIVQWAFFPNRFFEVWDMVANITGACLSLILFSTRSKKRR